MPGFTPFTSNYNDLSDENGYQFEFRCDICGSGYRSEFQRSALGSAGSLLGGVGNLLGGIGWGAASAARGAKDFMDRGARDEALKKASAEIMPLFTRCPRSNNWVDATCWNEARGLCVSCAPKLANEMEATRAQVEISQMQQAMQQQQVFSGDTSARNTVCTNCGKPVGSEKFCSNCGAPTGQAKCTGCGQDLPTGARFCGNCGKPAA